jgi:hypothetical protein
MLTRIGAACFISKLPIEILDQIIRCLKVPDESFVGSDIERSELDVFITLTCESACDLASVARVSQIFYDVAMPVLWGEAEMWVEDQFPFQLALYPAIGSKRTLSYIRTMCLSVHARGDEWGVADFRELYDYMCGCLRILVDAVSIQKLTLLMGAYNPELYPPECTEIINEVNQISFRILKFAAQMDLRELRFYPARETACIDDILTIIERKVHILYIENIPSASLMNRVQNFENMIKFWLREVEPRNEESDAIFWTGISKLLNVTTVNADSLPLAANLSLRFPHIVDLELRLWDPHEWRCSLDAVFKQFPSLERLEMFAIVNEKYDLAVENLCISSASCKNLRNIHLTGSLPRRLLAILGRDCAKLETCDYGERNVDDEDLRQLSRCESLRILQLQYASSITSGVAYLTNNQKLETLILHYLPARYITKQLVLEFAYSCPRLKTIMVSDWNFSQRRFLHPRPFETNDVVEIIPAAVDLPSYIEPEYSKGIRLSPRGLDQYNIRLDKLRADMLIVPIDHS